MKRIITDFFKQWRDSKNRKPLVIRGARQVGKTWSVKHFGENYFNDFVVFDFEQDLAIHKIFSGNLDVKHILIQLEAAANKPINPGHTLVFFDEIQECPAAMRSLRYFYEQIPELHIIAAGSLLEFILNDISFPVGRVQFEWMRPMGFREFLMATGQDLLISHIPDLKCTNPVQPFIHDKLLERLHYYFFVGGMPEAVRVFSESNSLQETSSIHKLLIQSYLQDFAKYGKKINKDIVFNLFDQLPVNIGKRIKYTALYPEVRIEKIKTALNYLEQALLIQKTRNTTGQGLPLGAAVSPKIFKLIMLDIGLLQHLAGIPPLKILNTTNLLDIYKGALAEQFVGQELLLNNSSENDRLYYWDRTKKSSSAEVDYLIARSGKLIPIEVKSGTPGRLKSIRIFMDERPSINEGIVLSTDNYREEKKYKLKYLPLYSNLA
jgi:uncharacterized protein